MNSEYYPPQMTSDEVDRGFYPCTLLERRDWSDSFVCKKVSK